MIAIPDPATFQLMPWKAGDAGSARMFCDISRRTEHPSRAIPASCFKRTLERADAHGLRHLNVGPELEFFNFKDRAPRQDARPGRLLRPDDARRR